MVGVHLVIQGDVVSMSHVASSRPGLITSWKVEFNGEAT